MSDLQFGLCCVVLHVVKAHCPERSDLDLVHGILTVVCTVWVVYACNVGSLFQRFQDFKNEVLK